MCDFQIDYRFLQRKSSTIKTEKMTKMKCNFNVSMGLCSVIKLIRLNIVSDVMQAEIIEAFNSTSRYLNDLLNIDNPYFVGMVNQIYPPELIPKPHFWICIDLFQTDLFHLKFMISAMNLILIV